MDYLQNLYSRVYMHGEKRVDVALDLEMQFRGELPVRPCICVAIRRGSLEPKDAYPILFEIDPILLRVRSMMLAKDSCNISTWFQQQSNLFPRVPAPY